MIMKIINTAREITFFAGSKPRFLRFYADSEQSTRKGHKGQWYWRNPVTGLQNPRHHFCLQK